MDELRLLYLVQDKFDAVEISVKIIHGYFWVYLIARKGDNVIQAWDESFEGAVAKLIESLLVKNNDAAQS